ncbi:hypothetical protein [Lysobacter enzymogenes]|uniref:hypothetical protein n=1 Tax=Lysobacter enzymogenes TaxID=69 RepID=UPI0015571761|nr:hypothetical protein [Lysobacter enzymogenes]
MISIATIRNGRGRSSSARRALDRACACAPAVAHAKSPKFPQFLPYASNAQCDVKHSRWHRKISEPLQMRNHSRFLNPIEKRLTGAQYFATQEWHDAVRRECDSEAKAHGERQRNVFSASASNARPRVIATADALARCRRRHRRRAG